ncbi:hypothetical protein E4U44_006980 [Claviceps purpurea]|nr:hypothetical protein E4U45_008318 [Claviceps purpurea]KAG6319575.1 hypothetical protein E4U44_006980 [Claviceps purpurea]
MEKSPTITENFPTLPLKLSSVSQWGEWYDTFQTVCESQLVWHKVDPEIVSNATNDCFLSPVMMTAVECFDLFCAKAQDKMTDVDPTKKTSLDFYYNDFKRKRETVAVKQSRLHAVRGSLAKVADCVLHHLGIQATRTDKSLIT